MGDVAGLEIELIDIGDAARAIHHSVALDTQLFVVDLEHCAQALACPLDAFHLDARMHDDADAPALLAHLLDGVGIERGQQLRQHFEDGDLGAGPRINMAEFECDHSAADEQHALRQFGFAKHLIRRDHQLGAGDRQRPVLGAGGDDDCFASISRPPTSTVLGPTNFA